MKTSKSLQSVVAILVFAPDIVSAEMAPKPDEAAELAKKLNNPVADLISVPFQNNILFNVGPGNGFRETTNIQPVIPFDLSEHWNLISRTILPVNSESTYDWTAEEWTVPFNAGISQVVKIGKQPVSIGLMGTWFAEAPDSAPDWGVRLVFTFLFPKG